MTVTEASELGSLVVQLIAPANSLALAKCIYPTSLIDQTVKQAGRYTATMFLGSVFELKRPSECIPQKVLCSGIHDRAMIHNDAFNIPV